MYNTNTELILICGELIKVERKHHHHALPDKPNEKQSYDGRL